MSTGIVTKALIKATDFSAFLQNTKDTLILFPGEVQHTQAQRFLDLLEALICP